MHAEDLQQLVVQRMPYGKYRGRLLADLPGPYLAGLARTGLPRGPLGRLLALMHELDHNGLAGLLQPLRAGASVPADGGAAALARPGKPAGRT